ncbi:MAG: SDR family oxidoreductase [Myxococcota bacterium]
MFDLSGRIALVTGAGRGIGAGIARTLASQGAHVIVNDLHAEPAERASAEIQAQGGQASSAAFDATRLEACRDAIVAAEQSAGPIDILVNNAGGTPGNAFPTPFIETPEDSWQQYLDLNFTSVLNCTRAVVEGMKERRFGRILSITSDAGRVGNFGSSVYGAAKAAADGFTRTLAKEVGRHGVTVNTVALGLIDTVPKEFLEGRGVEKSFATRRIGTPADVAAGVVYLASEEASWVTGQTLVINGGYLGA